MIEKPDKMPDVLSFITDALIEAKNNLSVDNQKHSETQSKKFFAEFYQQIQANITVVNDLLNDTFEKDYFSIVCLENIAQSSTIPSGPNTLFIQLFFKTFYNSLNPLSDPCLLVELNLKDLSITVCLEGFGFEKEEPQLVKVEDYINNEEIVRTAFHSKFSEFITYSLRIHTATSKNNV